MQTCENITNRYMPPLICFMTECLGVDIEFAENEAGKIIELASLCNYPGSDSFISEIKDMARTKCLSRKLGSNAKEVL